MRGVAIVLIALGLTGCIGPSSTTTADVAELPQAPVAVASAINNSSAVEAPAWKAGDAWETTTRGAGNGRGTLVVASASSDSYLLATDNPTLAGYDAMYDVSYVGRVRASDLAGAQRDKPVQFFAFPMKNGALWSTTWDGAQVVMSATFTPSIPTAGGAPGFAIVATKDGKAYATYDYVPALKWWSHLDFAEGYGFTVTRHVENWTGQLSLGTAKELFNSTTAFPVATINTQQFHVDDRQSWLQVDVGGGAKGYARAYQLVDPNGTAYPSGGPAYDAQPSGGGVFSSAQYPALAGDWKITAPVAHTNDGYFALVVHEVAVEKRAFP